MAFPAASIKRQGHSHNEDYCPMPTPAAISNELQDVLKNSILELLNTVHCGLLILQCGHPAQVPSQECISTCPIKFANKTFCNSFGLSLDAIKGKTCQEAFSGGTSYLARKLAQACGCHGMNRIEIQSADNGLMFEAQVRHLRNGHCAAILYDITSVKKSEQDLANALDNLQKEHGWNEAILNTITDPLCVISPDFEVIYENPGAKNCWGENIGSKCYEVYQQSKEPCKDCQCAKAMADGQVHIAEKTMVLDGEEKIYELIASPIKDANGNIPGAIEVARDITDRKALDKGKERLIMELQTALAKVKRLNGLLPICSYCKKIRDDRGYWNQIESYMRSHADVEFSHGICEECAQKNHPHLFKK